MKKVCNDCKFYLAVDVFKGICKVSKDKILPEDISCKEFEQVAKCKFCINYKSQKEDSGTCKDKVNAYPEMIALTCLDFSRKN
jgi:4-hydroxyphenylacetate decarboxylase small subunit